MSETGVYRGIVRRTDHRMVAGVAGGLGDHFGVSASWIRLGFVLATFAAGLGVAAYLLLWFLIPRADLPMSAARRTAERFPDAPAWIGVVLIGVGVLSLVSQLGIHLGGLGWALLLIGGGFLLFQREDDASRRDPQPMPSPPSVAGVLPADRPPEAPVASQRARVLPPRERSPLGWLALGLALAASGLVGVLRSADVIHLSLAQTLAIPLSILGVGLLVGTVLGRARWTVLLGIPLVPFVIFASAFTVPLNGAWGDTRIEHVAQVRAAYERSGGRFFLNLSRIDPASLPPVIDVRMAAGSVQVVIPPRGVRVEATVNIGDVRLHGDRSGTDVRQTLGDPNATTVVRAHVDVGEIDGWVLSHPKHAVGGGA
jgi:phage shock protein PspC (stress-responsive transcriptional regulator)